MTDHLAPRLIAAAATHQRNADIARAKIADFDLATEILQRYDWKDDAGAIVQRQLDNQANERYNQLGQRARTIWDFGQSGY